METLKSNEKQLTEFAKLVAKLDAPTFIGLAKMLCVHCFDNNNFDENGKPMPKAAETIIEDCIIAFDGLNRARRKEIIKILRKVVK